MIQGSRLRSRLYTSS